MTLITIYTIKLGLRLFGHNMNEIACSYANSWITRHPREYDWLIEHGDLYSIRVPIDDKSYSYSLECELPENWALIYTLKHPVVEEHIDPVIIPLVRKLYPSILASSIVGVQPMTGVTTK